MINVQYRSPLFRRRCEHCGRRASVVYGNILLCGDCFLEKTMHRYGLKPGVAAGFSPPAA